jgi:ribosome-associated heat shock protein Hsp15
VSGGGDGGEKVRIDKWLWAARFFKTRSLATEAVDGGKVDVNGARVKPAKLVGPATRCACASGPQLFVVHVLDTAERRGSADVARTLYEETAESQAARERAREVQRLTAVTFEEGKPDKRDRRDLRKFRGR